MPEEQVKPTQQQIQIRISDEVMRGTYANSMWVTTTREEFILDFGAVYPNQAAGIISNRIFMSPAHVKRMVDVLSRIMAGYESQHGQVVAAAEQNQEIGFKTS